MRHLAVPILQPLCLLIDYPLSPGRRPATTGRPLEGACFPAGSLVVSDTDGNHIARPDTTLQAGQRYIVAAEPEGVREVTQLLRG